MPTTGTPLDWWEPTPEAEALLRANRGQISKIRQHNDRQFLAGLEAQYFGNHGEYPPEHFAEFYGRLVQNRGAMIVSKIAFAYPYTYDHLLYTIQALADNEWPGAVDDRNRLVQKIIAGHPDATHPLWGWMEAFLISLNRRHLNSLVITLTGKDMKFK